MLPSGARATSRPSSLVMRCARSGSGAATSSSTAKTPTRPASSIFMDSYDPKPFRRRQRSTYVIAVHHLADRPDDVLRAGDAMLIRRSRELETPVVPGDACYFVTP